MNFFEAMEKLRNGHNIRNNSMPIGYYYTMKSRDIITCYKCERVPDYPMGAAEYNAEWQIYEEPKCNCDDHPGWVKQTKNFGEAGNCAFCCPIHGAAWYAKERKGLWEKIDEHEIYTWDAFNVLLKFKCKNQYTAWKKALKTFMRLKGHPLAVKAKDCATLFFIRCDEFEQLFIDAYDIINSQISELSPPFETEENGIQAISEIGKENLLHMFKTFSGIYE